MLLFKYSEKQSCSAGRYPFLEHLLLAEHPCGVLPHGGGTRLTDRCTVTCMAQAGKLGPCPMKSDGSSCMHQLFLRDGATQTIFCGSKKEDPFMSKGNKSLFMRDIPGNSQSPRKSHGFKVRWRRALFKMAFKTIEAIWMVVQIIQYIREIFHK